MDPDTDQAPTPSAADAMKPTQVLAKELNLFALPPQNNSFTKRQWVEHLPVYESGNSTLLFHIDGAGNQYTDLARSYLKLKVKIMVAKPLTSVFEQSDTEMATPVDNVLHSLWSDVIVKLNGTLVSTSNNSYPYKAYIENMLSFNTNAIEKQLQMIGLTGNTGNFDQTNTTERLCNNTGLIKRNKWFRKIHTVPPFDTPDDQLTADEKTAKRNWTRAGEYTWETPSAVEFYGPLMADFCMQDRLILNGVDIDIKLTPTQNDFRLMVYPTSQNPRIELEDIKLMVCRVAVANDTFLGIERNLQTYPVVYPFARTDVRIFNMAEGLYSQNFESLYQGEVPSKLIVGIVNTEAYEGNTQLNPFRFQPYDIDTMAFYVDDEPRPRQPFSFNTRDDEYIEGLQSLYEVTGKWGRNTDLKIDRTTYRQGMFLVGFDVDGASSPNLTSYVGKVATGRTRLFIKFKKALPHNVTIIVYGAFQEVAQIDQARNVFLKEKDKRAKSR
jgi:hypothetical protein